MRTVTILLMLASSAQAASSFNFDFGKNGPPLSDFSAAGAGGYWNAVESLGASPATGWFDTNGIASSLTIAASRSLFAVTPSAQPFDAEDASLLGDYLVTGFADFSLTVTGLEAGLYQVFTYTVGRQDFPQPSTVTPFGDPLLLATNSGIWDGMLEEGVTHSVHTVRVTSDSLSLDIYGAGDGFANGVQILAVPEPSGMSLTLCAAVALLSMCWRSVESP